MLSLSEHSTLLGLARDWPPLFRAMTCHRTHKGVLLDFERAPYLKRIYADPSHILGFIKATQNGLSEYLLCRTISLAMGGKRIFYVLPTDRLIGRFVKERWDKTVQNTPEYAKVARDGGGTDSVTMKQVGPGTVVFVGSNSVSSFTEFAGDQAVIDEWDQCDQENLVMVDERLSSSDDRSKVFASNPTFSGFGIDAMWAGSSKLEWYVRCPHCGKWIHPDFFEHIVQEVDSGVYALRDRRWTAESRRDVRLMCSCGKPLERYSDGEWVAEKPRADVQMYHVGKEFTTRVTVAELVDKFDKGLSNDTVMQRFWNADLGRAFTPKGSKIDASDLNELVGDYRMPDSSPGPCVAGVDVGNVLHVRINRLLPDGREQAVFIGSVQDVDELKVLARRYSVVCGVIDSMPEIRLARRVCTWRGWFKSEFFTGESRDHKDAINPETRKVQSVRTELLDSVREKVISKVLVLPANAASLPEYYEHMTASVRTFDEARKAFVWVEGGKPDHLFLAEAYATLARRIMAAVR